MNSPRTASERLPVPITHRLNLWIIEDDHQFGTQLSELINLSDGFVCTNIFRACEPAIALLKREDPPDLILLDIGLPGMNGIEGIKIMRSITPETKIVMLTVFEDTPTIIQAISHGAAGYLLKGASLETLVETLKSILDGGAPMNAQIARKILDVFAQSSMPKADYGLTPREREVLGHLVTGFQKKQIADQMFITFHTVDKHLRSIYAKLQVPSRSIAIAKALKENLL
ncbi:MAG: response regulator transcription factor [Bacteroidota bacterium]